MILLPILVSLLDPATLLVAGIIGLLVPVRWWGMLVGIVVQWLVMLCILLLVSPSFKPILPLLPALVHQPLMFWIRRGRAKRLTSETTNADS